MTNKQEENLYTQVFEMVNELNSESTSYSKAVARLIVENYNLDRVRFAIAKDWHLYELDRWEAIARVHEKKPLQVLEILNRYNPLLTEERLAVSIESGHLFIDLIVDPLLRQGVEIMELFQGEW